MSKLALRVFHAFQNFQSHARCARDYRRLLENICTVVEDPTAAEVAILHYEPSFYPAFVYNIPALRQAYRIGYCVWEADALPNVMRAGVDMMDELWTASAYCHEVFSRYHPRVVWIPHVVRCPKRNTPEDDAYVAQLLGADAANFNVLTITQETILRKNTAALRQAFTRVAAMCPNARLVVKTTPASGTDEVVVRREGPVIHIHGMVSLGALHALYARCPVYASAHCSEGWGLPMSDAMALGSAVVGTAYSGNLDFMTTANSFLVSCDERLIRPRDLYYLFEAGMKWAYVHRESLEEQLCRAYAMWKDGTLRTVTERAAADIVNFDDAHIEALMRQRLSLLAMHRDVVGAEVPAQ